MCSDENVCTKGNECVCESCCVAGFSLRKCIIIGDQLLTSCVDVFVLCTEYHIAWDSSHVTVKERSRGTEAYN